MKRIIFILALVAAFAFESKAQKFALIDMEYILKNIPSYEMANEQLKQVSQRWEKEITTQAKGRRKTPQRGRKEKERRRNCC